MTMRLSDTRRLVTGKTAPLGDFARAMRRLHIDGPLLGGLLLISAFGLIVLYSAVGESMRLWMNQLIRLGAALVAMFVVAQVPPGFLRRWTPWAYVGGLILLTLVLLTGEVGQGARRWLDLGIRFQPSEIMKLAVPMMAAWYLHDRQMPPRFSQILIIGVIIVVPTVLIARQPDLGTALLIAASGIIVIVLAGLSIRLMVALAVLSVPGAYGLWHHPVEDRDRLGRAIRQGLDERLAGTARIPAGA
jgi:rod shape determining protein RodA